eukprot:Opistho-2@27409
MAEHWTDKPVGRPSPRRGEQGPRRREGSRRTKRLGGHVHAEVSRSRRGGRSPCAGGRRQRRTHRRQVQSRGGRDHAQGPGRAQVQGAGGKPAGRQGGGRGLSELVAVRRRQGTGGPAAGRRAADRAVALQVRPLHQVAAGLRLALHVQRSGRRRPLPAERGRPNPADLDDRCGPARPGLLAQRHEADVGQQGAARTGRRRRPEVPHPGLRRAGGAVRRARRQPAEDEVLRSLPGAADRRGGWPGEHLVEHLLAEVPRGAGGGHRDQPRRDRLHGGDQRHLVERAARGHPRRTDEGDGRGHRLRQRHCEPAERRGPRQDRGRRQGQDPDADRRRGGAVAGRDEAGVGALRPGHRCRPDRRGPGRQRFVTCRTAGRGGPAAPRRHAGRGRGEATCCSGCSTASRASRSRPCSRS